MPIKRNGRWAARVYDSGTGRQIWLGTYDRKKDADRREREARRDLDLGVFARPKRIGLEAFIERWFDSLNVRESTVADYRITCDHITRYFGDRGLHTITTEEVDGFLAAFGKTHSAATTRKAATRIRQIFGRAVAWGYLPVSPALDLANVPRKPKPRPLRLLGKEQVNALVDAAPPYWRPLVLVGLLTGLRRSELFGLRWTDVLWTERRIQVRGQLQGGKLVAPKTETARRTIDVGPLVLETLSEHRKQCPATELDLVFPTISGTPIHASDWYRDTWRPMIRRAVLPDLQLHDLRHTFASALIKQGESIKYVQTVMGHASAQTTLDVYGHLFEAGGQDAARRLEGTLLSTGADSTAQSAQKAL